MKRGFYFPIIIKLVILSTVMLAVVTLVVSYKSSSLFESMSTDREESTNLNIADSTSVEVDNLIQSYVDKITFYGQENLKNSVNHDLNGVMAFNNDAEFYGLVTIMNGQTGDDVKSMQIINKKNEPKNINLDSYILKLIEDLKNKNALSFDGKIQVYNLSSVKGLALLAIGIPLMKNEVGLITSIAWGFVKVDRLQRTFSSKSDRTIFLVDREGKVLAHPNEQYVLQVKDLSPHSIIKDAMSNNIRVKQKYFESAQNHEKILGAFAKTSTDLIVVSEVPMSVIYAPSLFVKKTTYFILGLALSVSFFLTFVFSQSLTSPIEKLLVLTKEISQGNFDVVAKDVVKSHDEVGFLASAFDDMTIGLKERDKIKNLFNKFHGTAVTSELLKNEIKLGGTKKEITVFFSDIRGFTDFSEGHTPEEVVSMLNEYFEVMVYIINKNGGVVDKFIGDAIMAVWGAPNKTDDDVTNAVSACLEMRVALSQLNQERIDRGLTPIKIGMGLHTGEAISGQIGSSERMEFTVIGDAVNTASRIEGSTKSFGTDLLLSKEVIEKLDGTFLIEKAGEAKVQGKTENLVLYKVNGVIEDGVERIIKTPYSSYQAVEDKKSKVA
ncbi:MAG: adenylate/guanylate cyclase domain-containing protein [Bacteriovorax sp.]|nr:adenylate/guanylate cyclase domain-containing protein [Bacteriovorax sp.]